MIYRVKRILYKRLSLENYLRVMQRGFLLAYRTRLLKLHSAFDNHYYIKELVKKGDTVIDIGANLGYYSIPLSRLAGKSGRVFSVEPVEAYNKVFSKAARRCGNITLLPYALGPEEGETTLVNSLESGYLRTGLPHVYDPEKDGDIGECRFSCKAVMKRPSELFAPLDRIDFIKCDIEGFEYEVLSEMRELIASQRPVVQVEVWEPNEEKMLEMFSSMGYSAHRLNGGRLTALRECPPENRSDIIFMPASR